MSKASEYAKARYDRLQSAGKCPRCAIGMSARERNFNTYCPQCRAYLAERARERSAGRTLRTIAPAGEGRTTAEYEADRRKRAVAVGKCSICAKRKASADMKTCKKCRDQARERYARRSR
jgi:hypothetical protein